MFVRLPPQDASSSQTHKRLLPTCGRQTKYAAVTDAGFRGATFTGDARFESATFTGVASFKSATFTGDARFGSATFKGVRLVRKRHLHRRRPVRKRHLHRRRPVRKRHLQRRRLVQPSATFTGDAWFNRATFTGDAPFGGAIFSGDAGFDGATFSSGWPGSARRPSGIQMLSASCMHSFAHPMATMFGPQDGPSATTAGEASRLSAQTAAVVLEPDTLCPAWNGRTRRLVLVSCKRGYGCMSTGSLDVRCRGKSRAWRSAQAGPRIARAVSGPLTPVTSGLPRSLADTRPRRSDRIAA